MKKIINKKEQYLLLVGLVICGFLFFFSLWKFGLFEKEINYTEDVYELLTAGFFLPLGFGLIGFVEGGALKFIKFFLLASLILLTAGFLGSFL